MRPGNPNRPRQRGSVLIEVAMSYGVLVAIALLALKASINATSGQSWTVKQAMSDAYITRESALASRVPFNTLVGAASPWPLSPALSTSPVILGRLPGGGTVSGTLHRTRTPDPNNLPAAGGSGTAATNPTGTETWRLQSILDYEIGGRTYVKSRTVLRVR